MKTSLISIVLLALLAGAAWSQSTDASLTGSVSDPSGAAIPAAKISARNVETGVVYNTTSNEAGIYSFPSLPPGLYRLQAEKEGFRKYAMNELRLDVSTRIAADLRMELGSIAEVVEVSAQSETALGYITSSVGGMVTAQKILNLPLSGRNALNLTTLQAGTNGSNFNGARIGNLNVQMDGVNVMDARINSGINSAIFASTDRIQEMSVVTLPVDAELGRGSGQIQMITRSGSNEIHGSLWNFHRNTALRANTWFNNQAGSDAAGNPLSPRPVLLRNQFGGRVGGPIKKNKTFFHFLYEGQTQRTVSSITSTVYTESARRGIFRFFPGVQNGNIIAAVPTVNADGTPRAPAAGAVLTELNVFNRDPNRLTADPTGGMQKYFANMPLPNIYRNGDGLNTAGHIWLRRASFDQAQVSLKIDHNINDRNRLTFSMNTERSDESNGFLPQQWPTARGGYVRNEDNLYSATWTSTLTPNLVTETRVGYLRPRLRFYAPWEEAAGGPDGVLTPIRGVNSQLVPLSITAPNATDNDPQGRISPNYQYFSKTSWSKGRHNIKFGGQAWFVSTNGFNSFNVTPRVNIGAGSVPVQNINTVAGIGANLALAQNLLNNLHGGVGSYIQAFNSPGGTNPAFQAGIGKERVWRAPEFATFFQDDWKVSRDITLNVGLRYEYYGIPSDKKGRTAALENGSADIFGISGTDFGALFRPGVISAPMARVALVGANTANPNRRMYNRDWNNWSPALGLSWALPWFGKGKTVLRTGYSMGYERFSLRIVDVVSGDQPGLREASTRTSGNKLDVGNVPFPLSPLTAPLATVPFTDRAQTLRTFDSGLRTPYVQNFNFGIERQLPKNFIVSVRYVGSKGSRLIRGASVNEANAFETGIAEAFAITRAGGNAPLFDQLLRGLNAGSGRIIGQNLTGSQYFREVNATTQAHLANGDVGTFTSFLNTTDTLTGARGGFIRNGGFPENWIVANPQFLTARLTSNYGSSTYHSLQTEVLRRMGSVTAQWNHTFSKAMGEEEGAGQEQNDEFRTHRNRSFDKRLMSFDVRHIMRSNLVWELPFGPGRRFLSSKHGLVSRLAEGWQVGSIYNLFGGSPLRPFTSVLTFNNFGDNTPWVDGAVSPSLGKVLVTGNGVVFFDGMGRVNDPSRTSLPAALQNVASTFAITDSSGKVVFRNPEPGRLGNLGPNFLTGPRTFRLDLNLIKSVSISERWKVRFELTAENATNSPQWDDPNVDINSANFGRITGAGGARIVVLGARIMF